MSNLFELVGARLELQTRLEELDFDLETIADTLDAESGDLEAKIESYAFVISNFEALAASRKAAAADMSASAARLKKKAERVRDWLLTGMNACHMQKVSLASFDVSIQQNPASVDVLDEAAIPADYLRWSEPKPPVSAPDKKMILDALKDGFCVPGCAIKRTSKLVIK